MMLKQVSLIVMLVTLASCRKDDTGVSFTLPAATQQGMNTFGFLQDGKVWTNYGKVCFPFAGGCRENLSVSLSSPGGELVIFADRTLFTNGRRSLSETFNISVRTNYRTGTFSSLTMDSISVGFSDQSSRLDSIYVLPLRDPRFTVSITKMDTLNKIVSGTFSGTLFRRTDPSDFTVTSPTDSIRITEGRFDVKLQ